MAHRTPHMYYEKAGVPQEDENLDLSVNFGREL